MTKVTLDEASKMMFALRDAAQDGDIKTLESITMRLDKAHKAGDIDRESVLSIINSRGSYHETALMHACELGHKDFVENLLSIEGINIHEIRRGDFMSARDLAEMGEKMGESDMGDYTEIIALLDAAYDKQEVVYEKVEMSPSSEWKLDI